MVPETARQRGVALFNAREFYECHEALEDAWRPSRGEERFFLQALIHFAVGFHHHRQGNAAGAERQLRKALAKLAGYLPQFQGIDTGRLYRDGQAALETILAGAPLEAYPKFTSSAMVSR